MKRTRHNDSDVDKVRIAANYYDLISVKTRMVQLPAAAAIEYVAAVDACLIYIISSV